MYHIVEFVEDYLSTEIVDIKIDSFNEGCKILTEMFRKHYGTDDPAYQVAPYFIYWLNFLRKNEFPSNSKEYETIIRAMIPFCINRVYMELEQIPNVILDLREILAKPIDEIYQTAIHETIFNLANFKNYIPDYTDYVVFDINDSEIPAKPISAITGIKIGNTSYAVIELQE